MDDYVREITAKKACNIVSMANVRMANMDHLNVNFFPKKDFREGICLAQMLWTLMIMFDVCNTMELVGPCFYSLLFCNAMLASSGSESRDKHTNSSQDCLICVKVTIPSSHDELGIVGIKWGLVCVCIYICVFHLMDCWNAYVHVLDRQVSATETYPAYTIPEDRMWLPIGWLIWGVA